jgi:hypothetical protein
MALPPPVVMRQESSARRRLAGDPIPVGLRDITSHCPADKPINLLMVGYAKPKVIDRVA